MSNFGFCEIQKSDIPPRKIEKASRICKFLIENMAIFCNFWGQKYNSKSIDFYNLERDFGRILDILPYYTDGFFSSIFDFFPEKQIFKSKSSKKLKVQKRCQNGSDSII